MKIYTLKEYIEKFYGTEHGAKQEFCNKNDWKKQGLTVALNSKTLRVIVDKDRHYTVTIRKELNTKKILCARSCK